MASLQAWAAQSINSSNNSSSNSNNNNDGAGCSGAASPGPLPSPPQSCVAQSVLTGGRLLQDSLLGVVDTDAGGKAGCSISTTTTTGTSSSSSNSADTPGYQLLYCTGHSDGGVRLWSMRGEVPALLGAVPSPAARAALRGPPVAAAAAAAASTTNTSSGGCYNSGNNSCIRPRVAAPVSTLEFAWEQGLLVSGHQGGEVRTCMCW
jgi:hypothetical protein